MSNQKEQAEVIKYSKQIMYFLEEIVGGAAHEINNLLFIVNMCSELIETSEDPESRKDAVQNIEQQVQKIVKIISELRNVIKDCGTEEVKDIRLTEVSEHVINLSKTRFNNHKVILKNNVPDNVMVKGRENQLAQAFLAILNSAHDSVISNSSLNRWISFDTHTQDDTLQIVIRDSGKKIDSADHSKIFTPQFESKSRKGLPLLIAKNIIESHGGTIDYLKDDLHNAFVITFTQYKVALAEEQSMVSEEKAG